MGTPALMYDEPMPHVELTPSIEDYFKAFLAKNSIETSESITDKVVLFRVPKDKIDRLLSGEEES